MHADELAQRLKTVRDPAMRAAYVRAEVEALDGAALAGVVAHLEARATPAHLDVLLLVSMALSEDAMAERRQDAARSASAMGLPRVAELLAPHEAQTPEIGELRVPDFGKGRPLTLGERKTLARRRDRQTLARVLRDPSPDVIAILLDNPSLTLTDITRFAALRPVPPASLVHVYRHPRWITRYEVRRALVQNPYLPLDLAISLCPHLTASDAGKLARSPDLRPPLRAALARAAAPRMH